MRVNKGLRDAPAPPPTVHRLGVTLELRKTLSSTIPIENMFLTVWDCEFNLKRYQ